MGVDESIEEVYGEWENRRFRFEVCGIWDREEGVDKGKWKGVVRDVGGILGLYYFINVKRREGFIEELFNSRKKDRSKERKGGRNIGFYLKYD